MLGMLSECLSRFAPQVLRGEKFSLDVFLVDIATLLIPGRGQVRRADGDNCCPPPLPLHPSGTWSGETNTSQQLTSQPHPVNISLQIPT